MPYKFCSDVVWIIKDRWCGIMLFFTRQWWLCNELDSFQWIVNKWWKQKNLLVSREPLCGFITVWNLISAKFLCKVLMSLGKELQIVRVSYWTMSLLNRLSFELRIAILCQSPQAFNAYLRSRDQIEKQVAIIVIVDATVYYYLARLLLTNLLNWCVFCEYRIRDDNIKWGKSLTF